MKCPGGAWRVHEQSLEVGYLAGYVGVVKCPRENRIADFLSLVHLAISSEKISRGKACSFGTQGDIIRLNNIMFILRKKCSLVILVLGRYYKI